ncbi:sulfatase-like hydrolase/transferase [Flammeovirga yaeyamensis]|uniref:Sulfatase-like hydrolase/transferase n=1 Tax=Flammeovirga yaeyamensis TaxID=367791 RepID=A0AAX1N2U2_9BACT|nr:sulfatase-like hydrolase/transferase [Flammeovirga yaeyamensis]MBB3700757.1 choline-sulfatase [Flammeovirga yaeyamensis]NMF37887.1 sulfatase-like hydrolase/transferase [Flammeovirga yaeyamensis]QWG01752.1 sulfatase-like hydrolase/transferase [Flammeovirga yaeyamensis]
MKKLIIQFIVLLLPFFSVAQDKPNILVIITDQHSGKFMTQTGYPYLNTPGIDKLADHGVTFTRGYCAYPVCMASRAAMITGVMPSKSSEMTTSYESIGHKMKNNGYETAFFGKWHVASTKMKSTEEWHGFDTYKDSRRDKETQNLSVNFVKKKHNKPFFMVTSYLNPHDCCGLARKISNLKDKYHDEPVNHNVPLDQCPPLPDNFEIPKDEAEGFYVRRSPDSTDMKMYRKHPVAYWKEKEWRQYMYGYDRLVEMVDRHVYNLVNTLEKEGKLDNTIIFYTADHGDGHAAHQWNQKMTFYEESINVPFIISWKGKIKKGIIDKKTLVNSGLDLYTTICSLAEIDAEDRLGKDLSKVIDTNEMINRDYVISEMIQPGFTNEDKTPYIGRMVVSEDYKYFIFDKGENREQLFDIKNDPGELKNLSKDANYTKQLNRHRAYLREWIESSDDNFYLKLPVE